MTYDTINDATTLRGDLGSLLGRIDQYELLRELGGGGFGSVYLARDTVAGIEVAVKGLPPIIRNNAEELERIRENFALVSRLHHPYIAAALHLHRAQDVRYSDESTREKLRVLAGDTLMVMEYAPGVTLSKWRKQFPGGKVPLEPAIQLVWQIAQALDYAHEQHIIHRDIKPSNIIVETKPDGEVVARLLDFGLAAEIRSSMGRVSREIHDTSGTRPYMAPEQWAGRKQGPATDQYALAVLLCELLTGEVPFASAFETGDPMVMMMAVCNRDVELPAGCPRQMALCQALQKEPSQRFGSCMDFIETVAKNDAYVAPSRGTAPGVESPQARHRSLAGSSRARKIVLSAIILLLLLVVTGGVMWYGQQQRRLEDAQRQAKIAAEQKAEEEARLKADAERLMAEQKAEEERRVRETTRLIKAKEEAALKAEKDRLVEIERLAAERRAKDSATKIRTEAKVQYAKVARISDADGFKARKDSLEEMFIRAEAFYDEKAKRWADSEDLYRDYIDQSKKLISLDGERLAAVAKRSEVMASSKKAEEAGARVYAKEGWTDAVKTRYTASAEFDRMEFAAATEKFAKALRKFDECAEVARNNKRIAKEKQGIDDLIAIETLRRAAIERQAAQELEAARAAMFSQNWDTAYKNYRLAYAHLEDRANVDDLKKECVTGMAEAQYQAAKQALRNGDLAAAKMHANEAQKLRHPRAYALIDAINSKNLR